MNLFGKISIVIWIVLLIAAAIMFDWFGSRDAANAVLEGGKVAVEKLEQTGDQVQGAIESVTEKGEAVQQEAKKIAE
ncbi:hypothetical protein [Thiomicrorhabdus sediminis]|uniref:Uncharacterized protein n=1 Tax=Thiomicrorhabdus sediminis TaxID=2580412 RepID=A0A4P9K4T6_9GAMM|nr:hypothetical protein [Thiomicrorhabdus sediminis]QCU89227.1 hypothetical protein FE785_00575 [Thiomicrorhabdus sediminis]